ncbi:carbamoyltransferase HypF [Kitasatospora kifunensis]|uniref:Carbamoyltransferase n=1 Tax=Kitasatospora kifunensis TaxID=58351 RepID=A0A7W7VUH1_KITKI|nr:carbamoyltransferase HypF [Kitasatospora kifunensis]MBB4922485.1 hydrogenase maturation protein HypF [Kitasatospora kifunensis]
MTLHQQAERRRVFVRGIVQGVGFRPFVYGLATELGLSGQVTNTGEGVLAEVEGSATALEAFCRRIGADAPPLAQVAAVAQESMAATGGTGFAIVASRVTGAVRTLIPPDTATCADCLAELADPGDRRHRHPFITCTNCGPRFTIITALPYDRAATTMAGFAMCAQCAAEYTDPRDRRFHAQPISCHACGPRLTLIRPGRAARTGPGVIERARRLLAAGAILAVKGIGGYHLACDAANPVTVARLRRRKNRGDKPFALLARSAAELDELVELDQTESELLAGPQRPIVLLRRRPGPSALAEAVAPRSADLGVMLPYSPLHHLLLGLPGDAPGPELLVLTSANLAGEPIVTDDGEARSRLAPLVDGWLTHDRPIQVPLDDSVVRVVDGEVLPLRRSRGWAPLPVRLPLPVRPVLAVGGDLKNTFALARGERAWLSGHIGDMDDLATLRAFDRAVAHLAAVTGVAPELLVADRHPGYRSAQQAARAAHGRPLVRVQHHHAHVAAAMAEHGLDGSAPVIGVAFDGTGYGEDGAIWGGEVLLADYDGFRRLAHLRYAPLPGGDAAVARPYRMALAQLHAAGLPWDADLPCVRACPEAEQRVLEQQLARSLNCVPTSSMGRLFDAVAALAGLCQRAHYEAQAALELEAAAVAHGPAEPYAFGVRRVDYSSDPMLIADPAPVLAAVLADLRGGGSAALIAARFHAGVAALVRVLCAAARARHGVDRVALTGGVFANAVLSSACARGLREDGFTVLRHRRVPPNDGGLALGQLIIAARAAG